MIRQFDRLPDAVRLAEVKPYFDSLRKKTFQLFLKRAFDITVAALVLIILSPVLLIAAVAVKVNSTGPVFFLQERIGRGGKPFKIIKFRTMVTDADKKGIQITVGGRDPRITSVGYVLRKTSVDELPQMINILKGDMSLVGTRPEVKRYVDEYTPEMMASLLLRPGVTGQSSLKYSCENDMLKDADDPERFYIEKILPDKMAINLDYTMNFSVGLDLKILCKTAVCVFKR